MGTVLLCSAVIEQGLLFGLRMQYNRVNVFIVYVGVIYLELLRLIEGIRTPFLDAVIGMVTSLGEEAAGVALFCAILWCIDKRVAYGIGVAFFLSGLTVQGMKVCFRIDRPWVIDPTLRPVPSALGHATGYSFPSGHAQSAAALFGSLGVQIKQKPIRAACFLIAILVAFSRLYLGVHTPIDVVVSLLISFLFAVLAVKAIVSDVVGKKRESFIFIAMMLYVAMVAAIAALLYSGGKIERDYVADCLKATGAGVGFAFGMYIERTYIDFPVKAKSLPWQIIKFAFGFVGILAIKEGLKMAIGTGLVADMARYFLMLAWITVLFPLIIKRLPAFRNCSVSV